METQKRKRKILRIAFSKINEKILQQLKPDVVKNEENIALVKALLDQLEEKYLGLQEIDKDILDNLLESEESEENLTKEIEASDEYGYKFRYAKNCIEQILDKIHQDTKQDLESIHSARIADLALSLNQNKRKFKLPILEFKKFGGEIKDWLPFWGQFKKIHEDANIDSDDKFQYLLQATIPGSKAREIIESFPMCGASYEAALDHLKSRFAKDDLLIEYYMREMLNITLGLNGGNSKVSLTSLYDQIESKLRNLETLGVTRDKYAALLFPLVESCLKEDVLRTWQRFRQNNSSEDGSATDSKDRLNSLMKYLKTEVESEERIQLATKSVNMNKPGTSSAHFKEKIVTRVPEKSKGLATAAGLLNVRSKPMVKTKEGSYDKGNHYASCIFCEGSHQSDACFKARELSLDDRREILKGNKCCFMCLKYGHLSKNCRSVLKCILCNGKHVPLMCPSLGKSQNSRPRSDSINDSKPIGNQTSDNDKPNRRLNVEKSLSNLNSRQIYMQTLTVKALNESEEFDVRLLFDSGSQKSYVKSSVANRLKYQVVSEEDLVHGLFGGLTHTQKHKKYKMRVRSLSSDYACNFDVLDQEDICTYVPSLERGEWIDELKLKGITVHDSDGPIEILIGSDIYGKLLTGRKEHLKCGLIAIETYLGWMVTGKLTDSDDNENSLSKCSNVALSMFVQDCSLSKLWELDAIGIKDPIQYKNKTEHESHVRFQFLETVKTNNEGRYEVSLPWLDSHPELSNNLCVAEKRLENTVKKLKVDGKLEVYDRVLKDWKQEGIIEEVDSSLLHGGYYMPHRPVFKEEGTTKVRPVFDASSNEKGARSLNQCLHKGINLLEMIPTLLLRFRKHKIGVISDIKQAFLQISLNPEDRDFTRFLWMDTNGKLKVFRHTRVVFGITSSPFLLSAVIEFHLNNLISNVQSSTEPTYSLFTLEKLKSSFYVDNCVTSLKNEEELQVFIGEAKAIFSLAKFDLRGWEYSDKELTNHSNVSVLGLQWERKEDTLSVNPSCWSMVEKCTLVTRRTVLTIVQRIFDPIGVTCPITVLPKIILQSSWVSNNGWDEEIDETMKRKFVQWLQDLPCLKDLQVPRCLRNCDAEVLHYSIHTFCDASKEAYATAIFIRTEFSNNEVSVELIQAKSRIAPVKPNLTIPRLELMAATIGARLTDTIKKEFELCEKQYYYWSDSSVVIAWLKREYNWGVFVGNRVKEIQSLSSADSWRHVPGNLNPADLPSRGCSTTSLLNSRWWEGPSWLKLPPEKWPSAKPEPDEKLVFQEVKKNTVISLNCDNTDRPKTWFYSFSNNFDKVVHVVGWILRFLNNCRTKITGRRMAPNLSCDEVIKAQNKVIKLVQAQSFEGINDPKLSSLSPFLSSDGVIRIKTKVSERKDLASYRYPAVLPTRHDVVEIIILSSHRNACHVGVQGLLSLLREEYWIIKGRQTVKRALNKCITCKKYSSKHFETTIPPLPENRVKDAAVFEVTGCDLAGPLYLREGSKVWICLFTCAV